MTAAAPPPPTATPKLLDRVRQAVRVRGYSLRTEESYTDWCRRYVLYHGKRHPAEMGALEVTDFLTHLAVTRNVASSTQNQARAALVFLYTHVLEQPLPWLDEVVRAKARERLPVVLTSSEVRALLNQMSGTTGLIASLLYGNGMRVLEGLRLRVQDVEFSRREIVVRAGKGGKDRVTVLPENLVLPLQQQLSEARALHARD
jgi:site-specific recombinase XerD